VDEFAHINPKMRPHFTQRKTAMVLTGAEKRRKAPQFSNLRHVGA
jgi:hypothetical protein